MAAHVLISLINFWKYEKISKRTKAYMSETTISEPIPYAPVRERKQRGDKKDESSNKVVAT